VKPYYEASGITIYHGDCRELLPEVKADVLVTDPPYGLGERWQGGTWGANPTNDIQFRSRTEATLDSPPALGARCRRWISKR
jgi:DNA modification methylase